MKYLKRINERYIKNEDLKTYQELDGLVTDIFLCLTDEGYNLEVLHQNGYCSYTLFSSNSGVYSDLMNRIKDIDSLYKDITYSVIEKSYENYANHILMISKELKSIRSRIKDIEGLDSFDLSQSGDINIGFRCVDQGYENLGSKMLCGDPLKTKYSR